MQRVAPACGAQHQRATLAQQESCWPKPLARKTTRKVKLADVSAVWMVPMCGAAALKCPSPLGALRLDLLWRLAGRSVD